jgi:hypothetical protein
MTRKQRCRLGGAEAAPPGLSHSWPEANSLGVRVENPTGLPSIYVGVRMGGFFEAGRAALPQPLPLRSSLYTSFPSLLASLLPSRPSASGAKTWSSVCAPGLSSGGALALALAPSPGCACALLRPGPVLLLKLKLLAQAQGFGHHLPSLPSAKWLALARRWSLLLAPTSRRSIPTRQFASTSPQSSWTILSPDKVFQ